MNPTSPSEAEARSRRSHQEQPCDQQREQREEHEAGHADDDEQHHGLEEVEVEEFDDRRPDEDEADGEVRAVLRLHPALAPIKVAVFPLMRKDGMPEKAQQIIEALRPHCAVTYDHSGAIGRRYRRQDEVGTPLCV